MANRKWILTSAVLFAAMNLHSGARAQQSQPIKVAPFQYYIGKEVLLAEVVTTEKVKRAIETVPKAQAAAKCETPHQLSPTQDKDLCVTSTPTTTREGQIATRLVPDSALGAPVTLATSLLADTGVTVELTDGMLLKSINVTSTGRAGEVITSIAKFAGVIAGIPGVSGGQLLFEAEREKRILKINSLPRIERPAGAEPPKCDPFVKPYIDLPDTVRLLVWENETQCDNWQLMDKIGDERDELVKARLTLDAKLRVATLAEFPGIDTLLQANAAETKRLETDLKDRLFNFTKAVDAFAASLELGTVSKTTTYGQVLQLSDLPESSAFNDKMTQKEADDLISSTTSTFSAAFKQLWDRGRLIVTMDPTVDPGCQTASKPTSKPLAPTKPEGNDVHVYFRQGVPARLRAFIADKPDPSKPAALHIAADRFDTFAHPCADISELSFKRSAWAKRTFSVLFDAKGRPTKIEHTSTASAASIAASLAAAATGFRDELAATVSKAVEVQSNQRKIAINDLTGQIERTKLEKDLLDAQLSLDAAGINFDTVLKQKEAAAKLDRLNAELTLMNAEAAAAQKLEIDQLKLAVDAINREIDLIKARAELEKIKKG